MYDHVMSRAYSLYISNYSNISSNSIIYSYDISQIRMIGKNPQCDNIEGDMNCVTNLMSIDDVLCVSVVIRRVAVGECCY